MKDQLLEIFKNNPDYEYWITTSRRTEKATEDIINEYLRCFTPEAIHASCEDYRAGASIDLVHHKEDAGKKIICPLQVLWGAKATVEELYDPIKVWEDWADDVEGESIDCGHFLPEEKPIETYESIYKFLNK